MIRNSISVIIPLYNTELYIEKCLESIIAQDTKLDLECIIIDDCSTDNSFQVAYNVLRHSCKKNLHFRLIKNEKNRGVSYTRNRGLELSTGEYVFFVDSDDIIPKNTLSILYKGFKNNDNAIIVSGMVLAFKGDHFYTHRSDWQVKQPVKLYRDEFIRSKILCTTCNAIWNKLYKASFVKKERFQEGIINEDSLFLYKLSKFMSQDEYELILPVNTYYYRNRNDSYCNKEVFKLKCDTCENLRFFYNDLYLCNKQLSSIIYIYYLKLLFSILNELYEKESLFKDKFDHYQSYWNEISSLSIIKNLDGKDKLIGLFIKYLPRLRYVWIRYRLNK